MKVYKIYRENPQNINIYNYVYSYIYVYMPSLSSSRGLPTPEPPARAGGRTAGLHPRRTPLTPASHPPLFKPFTHDPPSPLPASNTNELFKLNKIVGAPNETDRRC